METRNVGFQADKMFEKYINELILNKVFSFDEDKILMLSKVPFVMFPARAMAKFVQTTAEEMGCENLYQIAKQAGYMVADEFIKEFNWATAALPGKMAMIKKMFEVMGFGNINLKVWNAKDNKLLVNVTNHPVIEAAKKLYADKELVCPFYMAIYSAHLQKELGIEKCELIETQCIAKKALFCEWSYNIFKQ